MKKLSIMVTLVSFIGLLLLGGQALAKPTHSAFGTFVNAGGVPAGSKLVLNVSYKVINDEDSGNVGYWALDNYNKTLQVWQAPDETFYVVARYTGQWQTFAGALSPGLGTIESKDTSGTLQGGYVATFAFSGIINPGDLKANGNIGTYDFGGTKADILLGTYGAGQTGPLSPVSVLDLYFPGYTSFNYINWGWTYHYKNQSWDNFDTGTTGDIAN
ncbi:MAG: hypothetical protein ACYDAA_18065 [Syntrophales bacterium]